MRTEGVSARCCPYRYVIVTDRQRQSVIVTVGTVVVVIVNAGVRCGW